MENILTVLFNSLAPLQEVNELERCVLGRTVRDGPLDGVGRGAGAGGAQLTGAIHADPGRHNG